MRGEADRECRAKGGVVFAGKGSDALKAFHGKRSKNTPDATLSRGSGPLFRKGGGKIPESFKEHEFGKGEDREEKATGGAIAGAAAKPSAGRPGRRSGGGIGADFSPLTHAAMPRPPKGRKIMNEGEKTP